MSRAEAESDEALAARAAGGDRAAFEILVRRYKEIVSRFIRRYVGDWDDGYDVLQDAFLAAWLNLPRYDHGRPFLPWLYTIALNKCRDFTRRQKVRRLFLRAYASERREENSTAVAASQADVRQTERLRQLDRAIATLPAFYKEPLLLTTAGGLSHQQAATLLGTTPKAVEMRVRRARKQLGDAISEAEQEG